MYTRRLDYFDYARAFGIFLVVYGHVIQETTLQKDSFVFNFIYAFHMPLFFVIAGMGRFEKYRTKPIHILTELKQNFRRCMIPYICWSIVYTLILCVFKIIHGEDAKICIRIILKRTYTMLSMRGNAPLWFLAALFLGMTIFSCLCRFLKNKKIQESFMVWIILLVLLGALSYGTWFIFENMNISDKNDILKFPVTALCRLPFTVFFIAVGYFIRLIHTTLKNSRMLYFLIGLGLLMPLIIIQKSSNQAVNLHILEIENPVLFLITGLLGSCSVTTFSKCIPEGNRFLLHTGQKSMEIMALHYPPFPIISAVEILLNLAGLNNIALIGAVLVFFITDILVILLYKLADKRNLDILLYLFAGKPIKNKY